jgi:hypothetical protein
MRETLKGMAERGSHMVVIQLKKLEPGMRDLPFACRVAGR